MHSHVATLLLLGASLSAATYIPARAPAHQATQVGQTQHQAGQAGQAGQDDCAAGVHIILARGTNEVQGLSAMEETADAVTAAVPGSDVEEVVYPATFDLFSQRAGFEAAVQRINDYTAQCPDTKIVLMGFSQGAWIMSDASCGQATASLPSDARANLDNVAAVVTHGDPTHVVPNQDFNAGTSQKSGITPRQNAADCPAHLLRAYCDDDDEFCDSGTSLAVHFGYNPKYKADTAAFVQSQLGQGAPAN